MAVTSGSRVPPATLEVCNISSSKFPASCQLVVLTFFSGGSTAGGSTADVEVEVDNGSRSARRRRMQRSGLAPVAVTLAAPVALGLLIGGVLAYQAGSTNNAVQPVPLGAVATPTPSFGKPSSTATGAVAPPSPTWLTPPASLTSPASLTPPAATASAAPAATPAATTSKAVKRTATANASGR
jgi:hypothetical protein